MNPTHEIIRTALRFSGGSLDHISIYTNMLRTYEKHGGVLDKNHVEAALYALFGGTINWLLYNIKSACTNEDFEKRNNACEEIERVLMSVKQSEAFILQLCKIEY